MKKTCDNCDHQKVCKTKFRCDACGYWDGWIPADEPPLIDEYVLIKLNKEYAGSIENVTVGIYFPEDNNNKGQWYAGHISVCEIEDNEIDSWRPLPN